MGAKGGEGMGEEILVVKCYRVVSPTKCIQIHITKDIIFAILCNIYTGVKSISLLHRVNNSFL